MRVLVIAASRHGSTAEIATALGEALAHRGITVAVADAENVADIEECDAVVLGSAIYAGRWLKAARELAELHGAFLASRPVWLFSSGPVGDPLVLEQDPVDVDQITAIVGIREHRVFAGKIDRSRLSPAEQSIVNSLKAPEGDYRDWDAIAGWAGEIADALLGGAAR